MRAVSRLPADSGGGFLSNRRLAEGTNIRTATLYPAAIDTELLDTITETAEGMQGLRDTLPIPPERIARVVAFALDMPEDTMVSEIAVGPGKPPWWGRWGRARALRYGSGRSDRRSCLSRRAFPLTSPGDVTERQGRRLRPDGAGAVSSVRHDATPRPRRPRRGLHRRTAPRRYAEAPRGFAGWPRSGRMSGGGHPARMGAGGGAVDKFLCLPLRS